MYVIGSQTEASLTICVGEGPILDLYDVIHQCREWGIERVAVVPASSEFVAKAEKVDRLLYEVGFDVA